MKSLFLYALACWRLSYMLTQEAGPSDVFLRFRVWAGVDQDVTGTIYGTSFLGDVLACFWCTSVWVAGFLLIAPRWINTILAGSALAIGLRKVIE